ncbi:MAG: hypothetical protein ACRCR2_02280 [Fusobacteriaceae bacterium]
MSTELNELQSDLQECERIIADFEDIQVLYRSRAFKKVVLDGLFKDEVLRLNGIMANVSKDTRETVTEQLAAISHVRAWFNTKEMMAKMAEERQHEIAAEISRIQDEAFSAATEVETNTSYEG